MTDLLTDPYIDTLRAARDVAPLPTAAPDLPPVAHPLELAAVGTLPPTEKPQ